MDENRTRNKENIQTFSRNEDIVIPVIREEVTIDKRTVEKGGIIVEKKTETEEVSLDIPLLNENLRIEKIPVNRFIDEYPETRFEGEAIIVPVVKEVIVKKLLLVEEIHIIKEQKTENGTGSVSLRKNKVTITRKEEK